MKIIILLSALCALNMNSALAEDAEPTCTLLDATKLTEAKFQCLIEKNTYHVRCDISAAPDVTSAVWGVENHKSGVFLNGKDGKKIFSKCGEREQHLSGSIQGDKMSVDIIKKLGHTYLVSSEILGRDDLKLRAVERSRVDVKLKSNERLTQVSGFNCRLGDRIIYAVISKKKAKQAETFAPERAWEANEKAFKLVPISNLKSVKCEWDPEGEAEYPF